MSKPTVATPGCVVLDWRHAATGSPEPYVFGDGPTILRSPGRGVPCHKRCAEAWIHVHASTPADLARLIRAHTPGGR